MRSAWPSRILLILVCIGCGNRPRAPELRDDPVYQNDAEGFRFLVPAGWSQHAKAELPSGKLEKERMLVQYQQLTGEKRAILEVSAADLPETADLAAFLAGPAFSTSNWRLQAPAEKISVNGVDGTRYLFVGRSDRDGMTREVVAFRRGERVYIFTGMFAQADSSSRSQIREAVQSTIWK